MICKQCNSFNLEDDNLEFCCNECRDKWFAALPILVEKLEKRIAELENKFYQPPGLEE